MRWRGPRPQCGDALAVVCDVRDREQVDAAVEAADEHLRGLDVVVANAGVAAQLPLVGGDPEVFERTIEVNLLGVYYTLRAAGPHIAHDRGYALAISSLAAARAPAAARRLLRVEGRRRGARRRAADRALPRAGRGSASRTSPSSTPTWSGGGSAPRPAKRVAEIRRPGRRVTPLEAGIDAIERGIARRSRRVVAPRWVAAALPMRMLVQRALELATRSSIESVLEIARAEDAPLTTPQPCACTRARSELLRASYRVRRREQRP